MTTYQPGEIVDVTLKGARVVKDDGFVLDVRYYVGSEEDFSGEIRLAADGRGITVTRVAPAEWPPRPGDLWRDKHGDLWFIFAHAGLDTLGGKTAGGSRWTDDAAGLLEDNAPLTLVHREPEAGERS